MAQLSRKFLTQVRRELIEYGWKRYKNIGVTMRELAEIFGIDTAEVWRILKGKYQSRDKK